MSSAPSPQPSQRAAPADPESLDRRRPQSGRDFNRVDQLTAGAASRRRWAHSLCAAGTRRDGRRGDGRRPAAADRMNRVECAGGGRIVGTGGDAHHTYNVRPVRRSRCRCRRPRRKTRQPPRLLHSGASDVLSALGVKLDVPSPVITRCMAEAGVGFMWAPMHHPAMKLWAPGARRARRTHDFQRAGADLQSGAREAAGRRRVRADWVEPLAHVLKSSGPSTPGSCTAMTAWMS